MKNKILLVVSILFGLMFISAGLNKFFNYMPPPEDMPERMKQTFDGLMQVGWLLPLVGAVELIGGVLFIIPKYRALGAILIFPIMVGIMLFHVLQAPEGLPIAAPLFGINIWVIAENWKKYQPMINA